MADIKPGSQKEPHSSGQDTMAGIAEIASSSTMSSSKTPLTGISSSEKNSSSCPSTTHSGINNEKNKDSRSTSTFKKDNRQKDDSEESAILEVSGESDEEKSVHLGGFGAKSDQEETEERKQGFYRDEYFSRKLEYLNKFNRPLVLDRQYTYGHTEGERAGEHVDPLYHQIYEEWKAKREKEKESSHDQEKERLQAIDLAREVSKLGLKTPESETSSEAFVPIEGSDTEVETDKEDGDDEDSVKKFEGFGGEKSSSVKEPEDDEKSESSVKFAGFGQKNNDDEDADILESGSSSSRKLSGFGKQNSNESGVADSSEQSNGKAGFGDFKPADEENNNQTIDEEKEKERIWKQLELNRFYSGHICHALEADDELHPINNPGDELKKIESLDFQVFQAVNGEIIKLKPEQYLCYSYEELNLHPQLATNLSVYGWETPLLVQRVSMYPIQEGQDILINAQTGSGKTGAFLIPLINYILNNPRQKKFARERSSEIPGVEGIIGVDPRAVIMTPTRELAIQIAKEAVKLTRGLERETIKVSNLYGGTNRRTQRFHAFGADIIVGSPGRVDDILFPKVEGVTEQHFASCDFVVLDEADRMLDEGFAEISNLIIKKIEAKRGERPQGPICKVLTSATFPAEVQSFANGFLREDYLYAQCGILNAPSASVEQKVVQIDGPEKKPKELDKVLKEYEVGTDGSSKKALVFANTKAKVDYLGCLLSDKLKYKCMTMHGDRSQEQREFALWNFATSNCPVLIATNVAARGLDIPAVDLIVNFDCSDKDVFHDDYIHRIGRTGRVGRPGTAVTFVQGRGSYNDFTKTPILVKLMREGDAEIPDWLEEMAQRVPESDDEDKDDDASSVHSRLSSSTSSSSHSSKSSSKSSSGASSLNLAPSDSSEKPAEFESFSFYG
ncbi:Oidioi.mRNA.OKI2018_I69.XSR.g13767.t1.cds [Oikopleura dioica]|uniref:RNA helicase n=1 Tax=Oikopleura dioica TaxID=34765 RepID=A0ABN7SE01_OIKDI|nr:Oidioi.mRNA.OKI2018_I69.XSR.g13767.t1.cds [Oikopleura dioica]